VVSSQGRSLSVEETSRIKELLLSYPRALRVLLRRGVPVSCAEGTIADAARTCGLSPAALTAEIRAALAVGGADHDLETARRGSG
jgi:hypothetical protein